MPALLEPPSNFDNEYQGPLCPGPQFKLLQERYGCEDCLAWGEGRGTTPPPPVTAYTCTFKVPTRREDDD